MECKCVFAKPAATWHDLIFAPEYCCFERHNGRLRFRPGHLYYYQLVILLGILDLSWIDI
ncbi:unnamed protein product, partial [Rotaria sp. Silwood1]